MVQDGVASCKGILKSIESNGDKDQVGVVIRVYMLFRAWRELLCWRVNIVHASRQVCGKHGYQEWKVTKENGKVSRFRAHHAGHRTEQMQVKSGSTLNNEIRWVT